MRNTMSDADGPPCFCCGIHDAYEEILVVWPNGTFCSEL